MPVIEHRATYPSPVGPVHVAATGAGLVRVCIGTVGDAGKVGAQQDGPYFSKLFKLFDRYFAGREVAFDVSLDTGGSEFQEGVWAALRGVPYGKVVTYGELARLAGRPGAARAVGGACAKNPVPIIVPCHRVVPASGGVGRFSAGPDSGAGVRIKKALLRQEGAPTAILDAP